MRRPLALLTLALLWAAPALAVTPTASLKAPPTAVVGDTTPMLITLVDCQGDEGPWVKTKSPAGATPPAMILGDDHEKPGTLRFVVVTFTSPGTYTFAVITKGTPPGAAKPDVALAICEVAVSEPGPPPAPPGPQPPPTPPPGPAPGPTPTPADVGDVWVSLISDANNKPQEFAQLEADQTLRPKISAASAHLMIYDTSNDALKAPDPTHPGRLNLLEHIADVGTPALVIQGTKTKTLVAMKCPGSVAEILAAIQKFKGK